MPVEIKWYIPEHVLYARYSGEVSIDDIRRQYEEGIDLCHSVETSLVHMIVEFDNVTSFPKSLSDYKGAFGEKARNAGWVIVVGDNRMIRFLSTVVSNLMKLRFTYVNSSDEAIEYLVARDSALAAKKRSAL